MKKILLISCLFLLGLALQLHAQKKKKSRIKNLLGVHVEEFHDQFEGTTTYQMKGNKVKIKGAKTNSIVTGALTFFSKRRDVKIFILTTRLQLENHIIKDSISQLAVILKVSVEDGGSFQVMNGESLIFLADGERIALSTEGAFNTDDWNLDGSNTKTHARYPITKQQLEKIINAKVIDFRIMQDSFYEGKAQARDKKATSFEGSFSKKNVKAWKDFYQNYIINISENHN